VRGGAEQVIWLNRLELEHDNLRTALQWSLQNSALLPAHCADAALRLAGAMWVFWFIRGHFHEGRHWAERALEATQESYVSALARGKALYTAGSFAYFQGDYERARILSAESLDLCREIGDLFGVVISLHHLSALIREQGDFLQAEKLLVEGLNLAKTLGDRWLTSVLLVDMGLAVEAQGHLERAAVFYSEALILNRQANDKFGMVYGLINLAKIAIEHQGDYGQAKLYAEEGLALSREIGEKRGMAFAFAHLGRIAHYERRYEAGMKLLQQALALLRDVGDKSSLLDNLFELAQITQAQGETTKATSLLAVIEALRQLIGMTMDPLHHARYEALSAALHAQLDEVAFKLAWTRGAAMSLEQAIQYALESPR
jgi:tetratricopeptide (TPR) repeat protein